MSDEYCDCNTCNYPGCTTIAATGWNYCNAHRDNHEDYR